MRKREKKVEDREGYPLLDLGDKVLRSERGEVTPGKGKQVNQEKELVLWIKGPCRYSGRS